MSVGSDIAVYLQTAGIGTIATDMFVGHMPDSPNNVITIYESGGYPLDLAGFLRYPTLQVIVRNESYATARTKIDQIISTLHRTTNTTINGTKYCSIYSTGDAASIGKDDQNRSQLSVNFEMRTQL